MEFLPDEKIDSSQAPGSCCLIPPLSFKCFIICPSADYDLGQDTCLVPVSTKPVGFVTSGPPAFLVAPAAESAPPEALPKATPLQSHIACVALVLSLGPRRPSVQQGVLCSPGSSHVGARRAQCSCKERPSQSSQRVSRVRPCVLFGRAQPWRRAMVGEDTSDEDEEPLQLAIAEA